MLPLARAHAPSLLIVSAGFDSAEGDPQVRGDSTRTALCALDCHQPATSPAPRVPQGDMRITPGGFGRLANLLLDELRVPTVFALEGGYVRR